MSSSVSMFSKSEAKQDADNMLLECEVRRLRDLNLLHIDATIITVSEDISQACSTILSSFLSSSTLVVLPSEWPRSQAPTSSHSRLFPDEAAIASSSLALIDG